MENPHETVQNALLGRINNNVAKLNDGIETVNELLESINKQNINLELLAQMWESYDRNVEFHLEQIKESASHSK